MKEVTYYVAGMHCASCELLLESLIAKIPGVHFVDASLSNRSVLLRYSKNKPTISELNTLFSGKGYTFSDTAPKKSTRPTSTYATLSAVAIALILVVGIRLFGPETGIDSAGPLSAFFALGILAGSSSCAALLGGIVISMSRNHTTIQPHIGFHAGRLIALMGAGAFFGAFGSSFQLTSTLVSIITLIVSLVMILVALQMIGIESAQRIRLALPKSVSRRATSSSRTAPFALGFSTVLLPCGFTLAAYGAAVLSGDPLRGALIMASFAIGTALPLFVIGAGSSSLFADEQRSESLQKIAGVIILALVVYNLSLTFTPFAVSQSSQQTTESSSAASTQKLSTTFTLRNDIRPNMFSVNVGQPVELSVDVRDNGVGCMSTIMIPGLYDTPIYLRKNVPLVMRFTPTKKGTYQITCAMGVPRGVLEVTE